jgi:hypothetical protein
MDDLKKLSVSLTKHGAYKIFNIMKYVSPDDVLKHVDDPARGVHIDVAQARKNMSFRLNRAPQYWGVAKERGENDLKLLVLLSICYSHHLIIEALKYSKPRLGNGVILRGQILDGKGYTNLANNFEELGFSIHHSDQGFEYDFSQAFTLPGFSELYKPMLRDKLAECGVVDESVDDSKLVETAIQLELNVTLGLTVSEYQSWLLLETPQFEADKDEPVQDDVDLKAADQLHFRSGHIKRSSSSIKLQVTATELEVSQLHNHIQNKLVEYLENIHGAECVGSEQPIGSANRVDVVVAKAGYTCFYEVKTAVLVRIAIRQALPQLMEYAFRPNVRRANELVIVAPGRPTTDDLAFLSFLRNSFGMVVFYMRYNVSGDKFELFE